MKITTLCKVISVCLALATTQTGFARGGGGGGGFRGGGFGGGFHGGGFGGGFRGGGFRIAPSSGTRFAFGTHPSFGRPANVRPASRGANSTLRAPAAGSRSNAARPTQQQIARAGTHVYARRDGTWHRDWDRRGAHFSNGRWWAWDGGFWIGLDDGFYPWDYFPYYAYDYYPYDYYPGYYADVEPYYNSDGVSDGTPAPDQNVEAVQQDLAKQGYYKGPIDGLYGRTTRDAVARYQSARRLTITGTLTRETLKSLGVS